MAIQEINIKSRQAQAETFVYRFEDITQEEAERLKAQVLTDPVTQESAINPVREDTDIEIGYKPGVTDPIELSLRSAAHFLDIYPSGVSSSRVYKNDSVSVSQIETQIKHKPKTLIYEGVKAPVEDIHILELTGNDLEALSKHRSLFLNNAEMKTIQDYYRGLDRNPTDVELETFAQTWSEHCAHKTFKAQLIDEEGRNKTPLYTRIKEVSRSQPLFTNGEIVTAFSDNAGGMKFYEGQVIIGKGETHNSPVAIEPYAGSLTKNGGLYRDIAGTGQGGKNLVGFMINNFSSPFTEPSNVKPGSLHPRVLLMENSRGERGYGNPMGIPTHGISLHFHPDFGPKPTSLGVSIGIIPESRVEKGIPQKGDLIVTVGGGTGRDGIHGATFSSGEMTSLTKNIHSTAVQLGDPIVERTMFDALLECRDANLIRAITDCGAGGYASAVGEMANGHGAQVYLDQIPLKYAGLSSWEKWLSESQERMVVAVAPENWQKFEEICSRYYTNANVIGYFDDTNELDIYDDGNLVGQIDLEFLHNGLPQRKMQMNYSRYPHDERVPEEPTDLADALKTVLSHLNNCSVEPMHRQYDMTVQALTIMSPFVGVNEDIPSEASVLAPIPGKPYGLVTSYAVNPILNRIDPYWGAIWSFVHAASRYTSAGGNILEACGIDNYVSPFPDSESLADLDEMTDGLCDMINQLGIPMVSGKDSLSSTYRGPNGEIIKAPPSLNITLFGRIPNYEMTVTPDFKKTGSIICLVGKPDYDSMGGSVYFDTKDIINSTIPHVDIVGIQTTLLTVKDAIQSGKVLSAKAIGEGGLGVALSQMCFGGDCGAWIDISNLDSSRVDFALFNETAGCILVELESAEEASVLFASVPHLLLGFTTEEKQLKVFNDQVKILDSDTASLKAAWKKPMEELMHD